MSGHALLVPGFLRGTLTLNVFSLSVLTDAWGCYRVFVSKANVPEPPAPPHLCQNPAVFLPDHGTGTGTGLPHGQKTPDRRLILPMEGISHADFARKEETDKTSFEAVQPTGVLVQGALPADRGSPVIDCDLE